MSTLQTTSPLPQSGHLKGHLGHLTADEQAAFDEFKERCEIEGLLRDDSTSRGDDLKDGIYDDGTLLRFLRARRFNVQDAYQQYNKNRSWRKTNQMTSLYESINIGDFDGTRKMYTHWTGRRDKFGIPVYLLEIGQLTPSVMAAYNKSCDSESSLPPQVGEGAATESTAMRRLFCTCDNMIRFVMPLCSAVRNRPNPESPVTQTNCIVDITGVGLLQFWRLRTHMQAASTLATAHYPETLGRTYIVGAPSFFPTIWGWLNKWFDPITVSKIVIVPAGEVLSTLSSTIDPANIPRKYGGQLDFDFGMEPDLDPEIISQATWLPSDSGELCHALPIGPMEWVSGEGNKRTAVAIGSIDGEQRRAKILTLG